MRDFSSAQPAYCSGRTKRSCEDFLGFVFRYYSQVHPRGADMFWRTHHTKSDPKSMRLMPLCLWGVWT